MGKMYYVPEQKQQPDEVIFRITKDKIYQVVENKYTEISTKQAVEYFEQNLTPSQVQSIMSKLFLGTMCLSSLIANNPELNRWLHNWLWYNFRIMH